MISRCFKYSFKTIFAPLFFVTGGAIIFTTAEIYLLDGTFVKPSLIQGGGFSIAIANMLLPIGVVMVFIALNRIVRQSFGICFDEMRIHDHGLLGFNLISIDWDKIDRVRVRRVFSRAQERILERCDISGTGKALRFDSSIDGFDTLIAEIKTQSSKHGFELL